MRYDVLNLQTMPTTEEFAEREMSVVQQVGFVFAWPELALRVHQAACGGKTIIPLALYRQSEG